jgi:hypothetical protein
MPVEALTSTLVIAPSMPAIRLVTPQLFPGRLA